MVRVDWKRIGERHGAKFVAQEAADILGDPAAECEDWFCDVAIGSACDLGFACEDEGAGAYVDGFVEGAAAAALVLRARVAS